MNGSFLRWLAAIPMFVFIACGPVGVKPTDDDDIIDDNPDDDDQTTQTGSFELSMDQSAMTMDLGRAQTGVLTINSIDGFKGTVDLALTNVPTGMTASFGSAGLATSVELDGTSPQTVQLSFDVAVTDDGTTLVVPAPITTTDVVVTATAGETTGTLTLTLQGSNKFFYYLPSGIDSTSPGLFQPVIRVKMGTVVFFVATDPTDGGGEFDHQIHANGNGFIHQNPGDVPMYNLSAYNPSSGNTYDLNDPSVDLSSARGFTATASHSYYCHDHGGSADYHNQNGTQAVLIVE